MYFVLSHPGITTKGVCSTTSQVSLAPMAKNDDGALVALGNDKFGNIGHQNSGGRKFYCGRNEKECGKIRGSDGDCGVSGGPQ